MFASCVVRGKVFTDKSNVSYEIPVVLTEDGPLLLLVDYFIAMWDQRSPQWMKAVTRSICRLLQYLSTQGSLQNDRELFIRFRQRLLVGTISVDTASDPTQLWWSAMNPEETNRTIARITELLDWWADRNQIESPLYGSIVSSYDRRIAEAAYTFKRNRAFLGHTWSANLEAARSPTQGLVARRCHATPRLERRAPPAFPEERILDLILKGFRAGTRVDHRNQLIVLLLNGAGFRESEPFHLYFSDVVEDPLKPGSALVLIQHPVWGNAPPDPNWLDSKGALRHGKRIEYLAERFGMAPRTWGLTKYAAGWKGGMHETTFGGVYKQAYWFLPEFGQMFWKIWNIYAEQVAHINQSKRSHPFAFVNTAREPRGAPYQMGKFQRSYSAALGRIGLEQSRALGTNIHGHRHAYAQRLRRAGISREMIRRFLHHWDLDSQNVYTEPSHEECVSHLERALVGLNDKASHLQSALRNKLA